MAIKFEINEKASGADESFSYSDLASSFLGVFTLSTSHDREMKRREKVRCELVKSQFGTDEEDELPPMFERIGQLLKLN